VLGIASSPLVELLETTASVSDEIPTDINTNCDEPLEIDVDVDVSVEAKLIFVEPGHRWVHSPAPGISYQGTMKTSVRMYMYMVLFSVSSGTSVGCLRVSSFFES